MAIITFCGESFTVDHAVKGADYVHGYDVNGNLIISLDGVKNFSFISYDGTYMSPTECLAELCNDVKHCNGTFKKRDGTVLAADDFGAAPAGFGLGPAAITVSSWNEATGNGFYQSNKDGPIDGVWFYGTVHAYDDAGKWLVQKVWCNEANGRFCSAERRSTSGGFDEWEWVNPPMELGVEYRTTERHKRKAVYVTRLTVGELLNKGATSTTLPSTPAEIIELYGTAKSDAYTETVTFPIITTTGAIGARLTKEGTKTIQAKTFSDYSGYVATATVKYTKD